MTAPSENDGPAVVVEETSPGIRVLTLNRPRQRNSLIWESWTLLGEALDRIASEQRTRCIVITGSGGFFSAGGDLKSTPARGDGALAPAARLEHAQAVLLHLRSLPIPCVAAVEGGAIGLGWSVVLSCDLVVAARDAFFAAPFVTRGIVPDGGSGWFLVERLGRQRASELLLTDARLPVERAHQLGLVTVVTEPGEADAKALELAASLAAADSGAVELTKRLLARAETLTFEEYLPLELATAVIAQQRGSAAAGRDGFR